VGERGTRLSGGQRQRIGIARALYKKSDVIILDEATSALDEKTEKLVMKEIYKINKNITIIMVSHRISTMIDCDLIYELDQGQVKWSGMYTDLDSRKG
jgi:ATP-binding cassette subfamily B protein